MDILQNQIRHNHFDCKTTDSDDTRWGPKGHILIHREALANLPDTMPDFFRAAGPDLDCIASLPDQWRRKETPHLKAASSPDHFFNYEACTNGAVADDRYAMIVAADKAGLAPDQIGLLPFRIAELYEQLKDDFAQWRNETGVKSPGTARALAIQKNAIYSAGILGHFVGDASQPLHVTIHHDGWNSAYVNPANYRTKPGLHGQFESRLITQAVHQDLVHDKMEPLQVREGDPLAWSIDFIREGNSQVVPLYELEKAGALDPKKPSPAGIDFAAGRLAKGASNLRDLWFSAWLESASLAEALKPAPKPKPPELPAPPSTPTDAGTA